jgi:hypothetical protein
MNPHNKELRALLIPTRLHAEQVGSGPGVHPMHTVHAE